MSKRSVPRTRASDMEGDVGARAEFIGRLVNGMTGIGLAGFRIRARQSGGERTKRVGEARTDAEGRFRLPLSKLEPAPRPWLRLTIADSRGRTVAEEDVPTGVDGVVEVAIAYDGPEPDIAVAAKAARVKVTPALAAWLAERRLETIGDVRRVGGIAGLLGLPVKPNSAVVRMIDGLAALTTLPGDVESKAHLVRHGYTNLVDIARTPERRFTESVGESVDPQAGLEIHRAADVQAGVLLNVVTDVRLGGGPATKQSPIDAAIPQACGCPDCRNALSPLAYLADLLDYAVRHLRENGAPVTITRLGARFHQPFATLPADCESLDTTVHKLRIAIEVLRSYLNYTATPSWYARRVYDTLLTLLGTSTSELRDARRAADDVRARLAARLGVPVQPGKLPVRQSDPLDILFDPIALGALTEVTVETLFGYRDTQRPPTDPDPLTGSQLYTWRLTALLDGWMAQDWPAAAPASTRPQIDPDQVDASDFADTAGPAYLLYTQRLTWIGLRLDAKRSEREQFGLDPMLQDLPVSGLGQAVTVNELLQLKADKAASISIDARLTSLELTHTEFDRLAAIVEAGEANVLAEEWEELYSILVTVEKRRMFPTWRTEEYTPPTSLGTVPSGYFPLTVRAGVFRLRPAPLGGDGFEWRPKPWRSDAEARASWVATLRGRIEQEEAVGSSLRAVIARAEEACLPGLRDELVALVPAPSRLTRADWTTRHLQIDVAMGACGRTTRVAQAITTVQGVLFGARNGLLEDGTIELDAPHFDGEWEWIGSYPSWRAAMLLFLYPEAALQPSLRRQSSHGFSQLLTDLQAVDGAVDADASRAAAIRYAGYFDDVCSLAPAGVRISRGRVDPAAPAFFAADVLAIAPADSGQLYLSRLSAQLKDHLAGPPSLVSVDDQSYWRPIDPLPVGTDVAGVVPYRDASGAPRLAVYGRHTVDGVDHLLQTIFDGSDWARPATVLDEFPGLVRVAELQGLVPTDPQAGDDVAPWPIRANDWIVPADIDGDGRRELVVFANASQAGQRAVGVLREREATLVTSSRATIPAGFTPFVPGGPVVLRVTTSTWPWRPERVLLGDPSGPSLALLGTTPAGPLTVLSLPSGPFGTFSLNFGDVLFAGGDLDDDGDDELLIVDYTTVTAPDEGGRAQIVTATRLTVLNVTDAALTLRDQETLPGLIAGTTFPGIPDRWEGFQPLRLESGRQGFLIRTVHQYFTAAGNPGVTDEWVGILKFNSLTNIFSPIELYPKDVSVVGGSFHPWAHGERLQPVELGSDGGAGSGSEILISDPGTTETRMLARRGSQAGGYTSVWSAAASIGRPGSAARPWTRHGGDRFVPADLDGDGRQEIVVLGNDGRAGVFSWSSAGGLVLVWAADTHVRTPDGAAGTGWRLAATDRIVAVDVDGDGCDELVALSADGRLGLLRGLPPPNSRLLEATDKLRPQDVALRTIEEKRSRTQLAARQALMSDAYAANAATPHNLAYLDEAFYFVPVELGLRCARDGAHTAALDWLATVYDYERPPATRRVAPKLELEQSLSGGLTRAADWLRDPLNPHAIATLRPNAYTRYTISTIVRVLLAYADLEFTREDPESVARALGLYLKVLELLDTDELQQRLPGCADLIDRVKIDIGEPELIPWWHDVRALLAEITSLSALAGAVETIERLQSSDGDPGAIVASARSIALKALADNTATFSANADADVAVLREAMSAGLTDDDLTSSLRFDHGGDQHDFVFDEQIPGFFMQPSFMFCVAPNPDLRALRTHAESCLRKIRTCRNIAGWATSLEPYAQPGPSERVSAGDRLPSPARSFVQPLPYRYGVLVERAKQLAQLAGQIQASLLGTLERRDAAAYDVLRSRQDLSLAEAGLRLHDIQVARATDGLALAQVGRERADLRLGRAKELLAGAQTGGTIGVVVAYVKLVAALAAAGYSAGGGGGSAGGGGGGGQSGSAGGLGEAGSALGGLFSAIGSFYSSIEEQEFQVELATVDIRTAETQLRLAADSLEIAKQERAIGGLRLDHAEAVAEFISRKFTGLALYEWMSGVLQGVYRFFLQQAAAMARLAEAQLAFERQEIPPPFINGDYWARPSSLASSGGSRGLTGSDRLLRDIYDLDQYAFRTDQRKLALTKTFSLARLDPLAFRRFMETGVMHVATPARLFDRDFPGHFLRLVKRVRVSIIVPPPPDGIHATLATTGVSRVVQGPDFDTVLLARSPESIVLTSADSATSPFELDSQPDLLVPFENIGVDTSWQLSMPKAANQFDFDAIADVLLTMEYTALDSPIHRERVLASLDRNVTLQRILSFRHELVDAWDDLHDAGASTPGARFRTSRADFAPNLDNVHIDDVTLYFSPASGSVPAGWSMALQTGLAFTPDQGMPFQAAAAATPVNGLITTVPGPGMTALWASLVSPSAPAPFGQWELALPAAATAVLQSGEVGDLVFVVGYSGMLPRWPD